MSGDEFHGPSHVLEGLRCPDCRTLDVSRLVLLAAADDSAVVECGECGTVSRVQVSDAGEAA